MSPLPCNGWQGGAFYDLRFLAQNATFRKRPESISGPRNAPARRAANVRLNSRRPLSDRSHVRHTIVVGGQEMIYVPPLGSYLNRVLVGS